MRLGQVSYFVIVAVLLLLVLTGIIYYYASRQKIEITTQGEPIPVMPALRNFVETCINLVATQGIYTLAYQGGYINPKGDLEYGEQGDSQREYHFTHDGVLPFAAINSTLLLRPLEDIQSALVRYVLVQMDSCLDMNSFEQQGLTVDKPDLNFRLTGFDLNNTRVPYSEDPVSGRALISKDKVDLEITYPLRISSLRGQASISRFFISLPYRLGRLHALTGAVLSEAPRYNPYDLALHCPKFGSPDGLINIYLDYNSYVQDMGLFVVDALPLKRGATPLRFQVGIKNINMTGVCKG